MREAIIAPMEGEYGDGQGADLLETLGWDDLAGGVIEASYS